MDTRFIQKDQMLSKAEKEANNKQWYKDKIKYLDSHSNKTIYGFSGISEYHRMKVNYDLFNNILDLRDFEYVCKPFGAEEGELPAKMVNRDILSNKIKAVLGIEESAPFEYRVLAVNPEATTRKEEAEFNKMKEFVINSIVLPIKQNLEIKTQQEMQSRELSDDEKMQIQQQIADEMKTMTPEQVKRYMQREHQDPAEVMCQQLLEWLVLRSNARRKFNIGCKHAALSAKEFYWVGENMGHPDFKPINPLRANYDKSPDNEFIEDGEWFTYEYRMVPSEVVAFFGSGEDPLTPTEIEQIYKQYTSFQQEEVTEDLFNFENQYVREERQTIRVLHTTWKSLREVKFLTYMDENGEQQEMIVPEDYKLNKTIGDTSITSEWIPEAYEGYKIGADIYKRCRPIPGQFKDLDNLYECKLPYYGVVYDSENSQPTSIFDRGKVWQYYANIAYYRLELLMASDKGKKVMMNINAIPDSAGIDIKEFQYFFETTPFGWFNPNEEGLGYNDVNTIAKVIDLSTASDMAKYIELVKTIKEEAGEAMGISSALQAQIESSEAVGNVKQVMNNNSLILAPFFSVHNIVRRNVLSALLECAKVCYAGSKPRTLYYTMDDMSIATLNLEPAMLDNTTLGLFINDSAKTQKIKTLLETLATNFAQRPGTKMSDIIKVIREDSLTVATELLEKSEQDQQDYAMSIEQQKNDAAMQLQKAKDAATAQAFKNQKELVLLKAEEDRKTKIAVAALTGASFNPDVDKDNDGKNDYTEMAQTQTKINLDIAKQNLEEKKFNHQQQIDKADIELRKKELDKKPVGSKS